MRTQTTSTSVAGLPSPQLQELSHMPSPYLLQQQQQQHTFDTKINPMMELNTNMHTRKHSLNQGRYHKKIHGKDYGQRKRNEYDEKFVSEMSVTEKELDDTEYQVALASSIDDGSFEYDDSSTHFEANLSCELTEFEKQILSKYLTEYSDDVKGDDSTDELDQITKCDEEIAHDDQPVILPTTIAALEMPQITENKQNSVMSDECASSSYNSDELLQDEEIQQFAKEYQIGTTSLSTLKSSEFKNNNINNNNDFGLSASIESSVITTISSIHSHQDQLHHHHNYSKSSLLSHITKEIQEDINNNNKDNDDDNNNTKNISRTNSTGTERDNNNNNNTSSNISSNRLRVILRNNYPIWIGITSCVWGLIIYLMKSYT